MKRLFLIGLTLLSIHSIWGQDKNNELLVVATFVVGDVNLNRNDKVIKVTKNLVFLTGDEIITKKGTVDIQIGPGSIIRIANNTIIKISKIIEVNQKQNINIGLTKGSLFTKVSKKLPPGSSFEVSSPTITAGVRGTEFLVSDESDTESDKSAADTSDGVFVKEGEVAVKVTDDKNVKDFTVKAGEEVVVTTKGIMKQILEDHMKEKLRILDSLQVMKENAYKMMKEQKEKNKELIENSTNKIK